VSRGTGGNSSVAATASVPQATAQEFCLQSKTRGVRFPLETTFRFLVSTYQKESCHAYYVPRFECGRERQT